MIMNKSPSALPGGYFSFTLLLCLWNTYRRQSGLSILSLINDNKRIKRNALKYSCLNSEFPRQRSGTEAKVLEYQLYTCSFLKVSPAVPQRVCTLVKNFWAFMVNLSTGREDLFQLWCISSVGVLQGQLCYACFHRRASPWPKLFLIQVYRRNNMHVFFTQCEEEEHRNSVTWQLKNRQQA